MRLRIRVYLDTIYNSLQGTGRTNNTIMRILSSRASKLPSPPTPKQLNDYFEAKGLK